MDKNVIIIMVLLALTAFQAGFLAKSYWEYTRGAVPMITPQDLIQLYEENPNHD